MGIKGQIITELELRKMLKPGSDSKTTLKEISTRTGLNYGGLLKWVNNPERSISDSSLDKIAEVLGKKIILVDKNI